MIHKSPSAFINVFLFSLFWALDIIVSKMAFVAGAKPIPFTVQSAMVALLFLAAVVLPGNIKHIRSLSKKTIFWLLFANAIHFGLGSLLSNSGIALTSAVNAGFLVKFSLVTTTFFAWLFLKERITGTKIASGIIMIAGAYFITATGQTIVPHVGDILIIFSCIAVSIGNILIRKTIRNTTINEDVATLLKPIAGIPVMLLFVLASPLYPPHIQSALSAHYLNIGFYPYVFGAGIFMSMAWLFLNRTLKIATASYNTMMSMMTPVFVAVIAVFFLGERTTPLQIIGGLLIIVAGIIVHRSDIRQT